jgi:Xaa-Pro aminopeptidase
MDYNRRFKGLQDRMDKEGLDLVVYGLSPNFQYITGLNLEWRNGLDLQNPVNNILIPRGGEPVLTVTEGQAGDAEEGWIKDIRIIERDASLEEYWDKVIHEKIDEPEKIGVGRYLQSSILLKIAKVCGGSKFTNAEHLMDELRMIKEPKEIDKLVKVAELTESVMDEIIPQIEPGISQRELGLEIEMAGRKRGAREVSFPSTAAYVKTGSEPGDQPFTYPENRGLEEGTSIAFDVGFVLDGYCSDWGRSLYYGSPEPDIEEAYESLQNAVVETIDEMAPGNMTVSGIYPSIEEKLDETGFGDFLRARLKNKSVGHQIGVEVHENPRLRPDQNTPLQEGMIFCIEPKLWDNGRYYLRVEDMVLITGDGARSLTTYNREQFQV